MKFITYSALRKEHGFSDRLIADLLGGPDTMEPNPVYRPGAEMRLYKEQRVAAAKKSAAWREYQKERSKRSERSRRVHERKRKETIEWAEKEEIRWINTPKDARLHKKKRKSVAYLRHKCTTYDKMIEDLDGKTGRKQAYKIIKNRYSDMIAEQYPELAAECERQAAQ